MKRQGLVTSIPELEKIIEELSKEQMKQIKELKLSRKEGTELYNMKWELSIINKSGLSDEWRFE